MVGAGAGVRVSDTQQSRQIHHACGHTRPSYRNRRHRQRHRRAGGERQPGAGQHKRQFQPPDRRVWPGRGVEQRTGCHQHQAHRHRQAWSTAAREHVGHRDHHQIDHRHRQKPHRRGQRGRAPELLERKAVHQQQAVDAERHRESGHQSADQLAAAEQVQRQHRARAAALSGQECDERSHRRRADQRRLLPPPVVSFDQHQCRGAQRQDGQALAR